MFKVDPSIHQQFKNQGYVVVENVLDPERDLQPVIDEYSIILDDLAHRLYAEGRLSSVYNELPFGPRLARIVAETGQTFSQLFDISLPQSGVTEATPVHTGPAIFNLLRNPQLLDVVESFIGPEIYSNPVQHVRIKPPQQLLPQDTLDGISSAVFWHQDNAVILPEADDSEILTVWLPITDSTVENGCLCVVPGSHRGGLADHCANSQKGIHLPEKYLPGEPVPVPMKKGSILVMTRKTMHSSLPNDSDGIRWSFDLRYNPTGQPTGRPLLPGFVARSRANPASEMTDAAQYATMWEETRERLAGIENPTYNRWETSVAACA